MTYFSDKANEYVIGYRTQMNNDIWADLYYQRKLWSWYARNFRYPRNTFAKPMEAPFPEDECPSYWAHALKKRKPRKYRIGLAESVGKNNRVTYHFVIRIPRRKPVKLKHEHRQFTPSR